MKKLSLLIFALFIVQFAVGQKVLTQTIKGQVIDKEAEYPLIGVNVVLQGTESPIGTTTDMDGRFKLEDVPVGRQTIQFTYLGFQTITLNEILITTGKELVLEVSLEEDLTELAEIVVTDKRDKRKAVNDMATISARSMSAEEITRFSGSLGDVARMAQNYAGVSGASDDRNDIIVRGNSPAGVLWRMEGVDIPSPNHWATLGSSGGPVSMLNTNNLRNSDFLSSAFPAEYGNATAAVFDLKLRNGNPDKFEVLAQIGFNGFEAGLEGPLGVGTNSSFMINYRYSTLGVISALGIDFGTGFAVPEYQDINFKFNMPTEKAGRFSLWGLGGVSDIVFEPQPDDDNLFSDGDEELKSSSRTGIVGLSHLYFFNEKTSSNLQVSYAASESKASVKEIVDKTTELFEPTFTSMNLQEKIGVNWTINKKFNAKNRMKTGLIYDNYDLNVQDSVLINNAFWYTEIDFKGNVGLYRAFAQWQHKFNNKLTLNAGLHGSLFGFNNSNAIEPRLGFSYEATPKSTLGVGYGMHSQLQPLPIYFAKSSSATAAQNLANEELDLIRSHHFVLSWDYSLTKNTRVKTEAYYQLLNGLAVDPDDGDFSMINYGADFGFPNRVGLTNDGTGSNYGLELTFERFLDKGFYFLFTGSLFNSQYKGSDEIERNTFFNSNYVTNLLVGKEFTLSDHFTLTLDARMNFAGGRRYTPIDLEASILTGQEILDETKIFEAQYDPYMRPDLKIGFRHNAKKYTQTFSVDLQNFISRKNVFLTQYNEVEQELKTTYQRGFFPDVRYQITF